MPAQPFAHFRASSINRRLYKLQHSKLYTVDSVKSEEPAYGVLALNKPPILIIRSRLLKLHLRPGLTQSVIHKIRKHREFGAGG